MQSHMNYRITLNNPKKEPNGRGGWLLNYAAGDFMEVWTAVTSLTINQQLRYQEHQEAADVVFTIRENPFINKDTKIKFAKREHSVSQKAPNPDNPRFWDIRARGL